MGVNWDAHALWLVMAPWIDVCIYGLGDRSHAHTTLLTHLPRSAGRVTASAPAAAALA